MRVEFTSLSSYACSDHSICNTREIQDGHRHNITEKANDDASFRQNDIGKGILFDHNIEGRFMRDCVTRWRRHLSVIRSRSEC